MKSSMMLLSSANFTTGERKARALFRKSSVIVFEHRVSRPHVEVDVELDVGLNDYM